MRRSVCWTSGRIEPSWPIHIVTASPGTSRISQKIRTDKARAPAKLETARWIKNMRMYLSRLPSPRHSDQRRAHGVGDLLADVANRLLHVARRGHRVARTQRAHDRRMAFGGVMRLQVRRDRHCQD